MEFEESRIKNRGELSIFPAEVIGRVFRFLPVIETPNVATASYEFPDIFLLYALPDTTIRHKAVVSNTGRVLRRAGCFYRPKFLDIYQVKDIPLIIKSGLMPIHFVLGYLAKRGLLDVIKTHWSRLAYSRRGGISWVTIERVWTRGIHFAAANGHLDVLKWLYDRWYRFTFIFKDNRKILCLLVHKAIPFYLLPTDIREKVRVGNLEISVAMRILHNNVLHASKEHPAVVEWLLSIVRIDYSLDEIFKSISSRYYKSPRTKASIESVKLVLDAMKNKGYNWVEPMINSIRQAVFSRIPDVDMFKFLLSQRSNRNINDVISFGVMDKIVRIDMVDILTIILEDLQFDLNIYGDLYRTIVIRKSYRVLDLILSDGRLDPVLYLFGVAPNGKVRPLYPLRTLIQRKEYDALKRLYQDARVKIHMTEEFIEQYGLTCLLETGGPHAFGV